MARPQCLGRAGGTETSASGAGASSKRLVAPRRAALVAPGRSPPGDVVASARDAGEQLQCDGGAAACLVLQTL